MTTAISDVYGSAHDSASDDLSLAGFLDPEKVMAEAAPKATGPWPFAHTLGLGLIASAILWAVIAAVVHYFL